jgi:L-threonylcarbamoyladenylate synthase
LLRHHYSPKAEVVIDSIPQPGDGFIALADVPTPAGVIRLASPANLEEYARLLYSAFRAGDRFEIKKVVAIQPSGEGLAYAIRDRLARASSI